MKTWEGFQKGVNLGGWYSQCDYSEERYNNFIKDEDFNVIKSWGLDHIRLPIDYQLIETDDGHPIAKGIERIQHVIDQCKLNGLNMILDLHKTAGYFFHEEANEMGFFEDEKLQERFYALWIRLAKEFGKYDDMLAFELLNEVTSKEYCDPWNRISNECVKRIREYAPKIKILIGGYYNNSVEAVKDIAAPYDENIIYNFHCYEPLIFTHQGAPWIPTMDTSFRVNVDAPYSEMDAAGVKMLSQVTTGFPGFEGTDTLSPAYFEAIFKEALEVAEERNVALYCGEYGVIDRTSPEQALKWYQTINAVFTKYGIGRAAWSYREMDFGLSDSRMDGVRDELIKYL